MHFILYDWPYVGLAAGLAGLALLLTTPQPGAWRNRWRDPSWLVCLILPVYMLHQFEEHGINLLGQHFHFLVEMCRTLGHSTLSTCPATPAFILAVNCGGGVWIPGGLAIAFRRRNVMVGACTLGIPLINSVAHIGQAIYRGGYNSGLLTALVLFLPMCGWILFQFRRAGLLTRPRFAAILASGILLHLALIGSLLGKEHGLWGEPVVLLINVVDFLIPVGLATLVRVRPSSPETDAALTSSAG